jgi:hypothetical protein
MDVLKKPIGTVLLLAGLTEIIYLAVFTGPLSLIKYYAITPPVDYAKLTGHSVGGVIAYVAGVLSLFILYSWLLTWEAAPKLSILVPYAGLVFGLTLLFSYPALAIDLLIYAIRARIWGLYGLNPLAARPDSLPISDPWAPLAAEWGDIASPYGPLWETIGLGTFHLAGGDFLAQLFWLKGIALFAYVGSIWLIGQILDRLQPDWKIVGMIAFAWNPLVLLEVAQNGHNDILMIFFVLAAVWALVTERLWWVIPLLAVSIQVKYVSIVIAPIFLINLALRQADWSKRLLAFVTHGVIFILLIGLPMLPLWPGWDNWAVLALNSGAGRSVLALSVLGLSPWLGLGLAFDGSQLVLNLTFVVIWIWLAWQKRRQLRQTETIIYLGWAAFFWYLLLAVPVFHGWYLLWSLPMAALLLPKRTALQATIVFTLTALLIIPYFETIRIWFPVLLQNHLLGHALGVPLLVLPPAIIAFRAESAKKHDQASQVQPAAHN